MLAWAVAHSPMGWSRPRTRPPPGCPASAPCSPSTPPTGGAYSHFRPGEMQRFGPVLAGPAGRVHVAGEHTDPWQATMNGALASGLRAAREVLKQLDVSVHTRRTVADHELG